MSESVPRRVPRARQEALRLGFERSAVDVVHLEILTTPRTAAILAMKIR